MPNGASLYMPTSLRGGVSVKTQRSPLGSLCDNPAYAVFPSGALEQTTQGGARVPWAAGGPQTRDLYRFEPNSQ